MENVELNITTNNIPKSFRPTSKIANGTHATLGKVLTYSKRTHGFSKTWEFNHCKTNCKTDEDRDHKSYC